MLNDQFPSEKHEFQKLEIRAKKSFFLEISSQKLYYYQEAQRMVSNCLIEALKAKIKDPKNVKIDYVPPFINDGRMHFTWINYKEEKVYHYHARDERPFWRRPLFDGKFRVMELRVYEGFILHKLYKNNFSVEKAFQYVKKHRLHITEDDVKDCFEMEEMD